MIWGGVLTTVIDIHQGGGCALSIAYGMKGVASPPPDKFIVFSVKHDCPSFTNFKHKFPVPSNLPACKEGDCVCGWHWVPDSKASANEMVNISGSSVIVKE